MRENRRGSDPFDVPAWKSYNLRERLSDAASDEGPPQWGPVNLVRGESQQP